MGKTRRWLVWMSAASVVLMFVGMFAHWYVAIAVFAVFPVAIREVYVWTLGRGPLHLIRGIIRDLVCSTGRHPFVVPVKDGDRTRFYCAGCSRSLGVFRYDEIEKPKHKTLFVQQREKVE